jgi:glycosyl transferase family 25
MKAYCINLDRRSDRLEYMAHQFNIQGMTAERIAAIDGTLPEVAAATALVQPILKGQNISVGAYGCFQSHREAWRKIAVSGEAHGIVMEDDLVLADGFSSYLKDCWVPSDADVVRLETFLMRTHLDMSVNLPAGSRNLWRLRSMHLGAGCYVISAAAAQRLYDCTAVIRYPVDVALFCETSEFFAELVTYQMVPAPAVQEQRLRRKSFDASWLATNIRDKSHNPSRHAETLLCRLRRRMIETLRAWRQRTRYAVVPFG